MKKKIKRFIALLMAVLVLFSVPTVSYAENTTDTITVDTVINCKLRYYRSKTVGEAQSIFVIPVTDSTSWVDLESSSTYGIINWYNFKDIILTSDPMHVEGKGRLNFDLQFSYSCLGSLSFSSDNISCSIYTKDINLVKSTTAFTNNGSRLNVTIQSQDIVSNGDYYFHVQIINPVYRNSDYKEYEDYGYNMALNTNSVEPTFKTNSDNFFDGIFSFLSEKFEQFNNALGAVKSAILDIPDKINSKIQIVIDKFKDITDSIKQNLEKATDTINGFFSSLKNHLTNLTEKIKGFFADIGNQISALWQGLVEKFKDIGDWFSTLWKNISDKVVEIKTDISDWFKSLFVVTDGFWDEYKANFDTFLSEHFGFLYQSMTIITNIVTTLKSSLDGNGSGMFTYKKLSIPESVLGQEFVLLNSRRVNLKDYINKDSSGQLAYIYDTLRVINSALILLLIVNRGKKLFEMIITNGEAVEE